MSKDINIAMQHQLLGAYMNTSELFDDVIHLVRHNSKTSIWTTGFTRKAYDVIRGYHKKGIKPDPMLVYKALKSEGFNSNELAEVSNWSLAYLTKKQVSEYVSQLFSDYSRNYLLPITTSVAQNLASGEEPIEEMQRLKDAITAIELAMNGVNKDEGVKSVLAKLLGKINDMKNGKLDAAAFSWGLPSVDEKTIGIMRGINVVAGDKGCGKTSLIINIMKKHVLDEQKPLLFFSLEMSAEDVITNLVANYRKINSKAIRTAQLFDDELLSMQEIDSLLDNDKFVIDETGGITWQYFEAKCKAFRSKNKIPQSQTMLVMLDYLGLMKNSADEMKMNKEERIEQICTELMRVCKNENIALVLLAQFSRESSKRGNDTAYIRDERERLNALLAALRPKFTDLKGSSAIESNAVNILLLYRPEYYGILEGPNGGDLRGVCEINAAKARFSNTGAIRVKFTGKYNLFEEYPKEAENKEQNDIVTGKDKEDVF